MNDREEEWKDVVGFEGLYQVSNLGRVKSLPRTNICVNGKPLTTRGMILKNTKNHRGYYEVNLFKRNDRKHKCIHVLLAETFIPNPDNLPLVLHKNDIKLDNRIENLYWGNHNDNMKDRLSNGKHGSGNAVLTVEKVKEIKSLIPFKTQFEIARMFKISHTTVGDIKRGKTWKTV
jgi:hypothetical protein